MCAVLLMGMNSVKPCINPNNAASRVDMGIQCDDHEQATKLLVQLRQHNLLLFESEEELLTDERCSRQSTESTRYANLQRRCRRQKHPQCCPHQKTADTPDR